MPTTTSKSASKRQTFCEFYKRKSAESPQPYSKLVKFNENRHPGWNDLTDEFFDSFADFVKSEVSSGSACTYFSIITTVLDKAKLAGYRVLSKNYREILKSRPDKVAKTWLTMDDLRKIEAFKPKSEVEQSVQTKFLIGAYTGARQSDFEGLNESNIVNDRFEFVSQKTKTKSTVPIKPLVRKLIKREVVEVTDVTFNDVLRKICKAVGIDYEVNVLKSGELKRGAKWRFITSHTARISFATNMYIMGCDILAISKMLGHSSIAMTERYIVCDKIEIPAAAMEYFK